MTRINYHKIALAAFLTLITAGTFAQSDAIVNPKLEAVMSRQANELISEDMTYALPWAPIPESNILMKRRVWRQIDAKKSNGGPFAATQVRQDNLASILLQGAIDGKIKAYNAATDNFSQELTRDQLVKLITPGGGSFFSNPANVTSYRIKEDWLFLKDEHKLIVRILGIAPIGKVNMPDGVSLEEPLFWIYYPDSRKYLATQKATTEVTWDQLFEARDFESNVIQDYYYRPYLGRK